jgi:hypothetical protein
MRKCLFVLVICGASNAAWASDCGVGTIAANFQRFQSAEFAGRLAIAPWAQNSTEAKGAQLYCILDSGNAHVRKRLDRLYFVFNNMVTSSPENAETAFAALEVRASAPAGQVAMNMRREGDSWEMRKIDQQYPEHQITYTGDDARMVSQAHQPRRLASLSGAYGDTSEEDFARRVKASVHGAVRPKPGAELKTTWEQRYRLGFLGQLFGANESQGQSVTAIWTSFDQRSTAPLHWVKRVATEVRVGNATEIDVHLFGSNGEIPEMRYHVYLE